MASEFEGTGFAAPCSHGAYRRCPGSPGMAFFSEPEFAAIVTANDTAVVSVATGEPLVGEPAAVDAVRAYLQILYSDLQSK